MSTKFIRFFILSSALTGSLLFYQNCGKQSSSGGSTLKSEGLITDETGALIPKISAGDVSIEKSILVTDYRVLNSVVTAVDFAEILGRVYRYSVDVVGPSIKDFSPGSATPGEYVRKIIQLANNEQIDHAGMAQALKLGDDPKPDRYMSRVFDNWMAKEDLESIKTPAGLKGGPFRLLAIANLMENAGVIDNRGTNEASAQIRSLGEMHLVYGLIDKEYEKNGKAYPQTWVLSFRLPAIKKVNNKWVLAIDYSQDFLARNEDQWQAQMHNWAELWGSLTPLEITSEGFAKKLKEIFTLVVAPSHFINVRSNTKITDSEFELREWYILGPSQQLIPRKPRNEPYRCLSGSQELAKLVNYYWRADKDDLDVFTYNTKNPKPNDKDANGFMLPRDNAHELFLGQASFSTCPSALANMPFEMDSQAPRADEGRTAITAPFGRLKFPDQAWKLLNGAGSVAEAQRHSFAIRTCTGCHGSEGAAQGFHIAPRLKNENSKLSPFLTGKGNNKFSFGGTNYNYQTLQDRLNWHVKSFNKEGQIFGALRRVDKAE